MRNYIFKLDRLPLRPHADTISDATGGRATSLSASLCGMVAVLLSFQAYAVQFTNVTSAAGLNYNGESTGATWVDYDGDFRQDIWSQHHRRRSGLYRNNGDGTFTSVILQMDGSQKLTASAFGGIDTHGAAWADFDNDGDQDFYPANGAYTNVHFYVNYGNVMLEEATSRNVPDDAGAWGGSWFDYDRDGLLDLMQNKIFSSATLHQQSDHSFQKVNFSVGSCDGADWSQIFDLDLDGELELLCLKNDFVEKAFRITGGGPFVDITNTLPYIESVVDTALADFDNDGRTDVYVQIGRVQPSEAAKTGDKKAEGFFGVTAQEKGMRFDTTGDLTIVLTTEHFLEDQIYIGANGVNPTSFTFTVNGGDPNAVGILPHTPGTNEGEGLYVGKTGANTWEIYFASGPKSARAYVDVTSTATVTNVTRLNMNGTDNPRKPQLLMNTAGGFVDEAPSRGLTQAVTCKSAAAADYDNDGDVDVFLACGISVSNLANRLYLNDGNGSFVAVTNFGGEGAVGAGLANNNGAGESVVAADYDNDGRMDVFVTNGARLSPIKVGGPDQLFRNTTSNNNEWLKLRLVGTVSNRDALGAKVYATSGSLTQFREHHGGFRRWSQDSRDIHFGFGELGANPTIDQIRVEWPNGFIDTFNNVDANKFYTVTERASAGAVGSIQEVVLGPIIPMQAAQPGDECGGSLTDASQDRGIYINRTCPDGDWQLIAIAGGSDTTIRYQGDITADGNLSVQNTGTLESWDSVTANGNTIDFDLRVRKQNVDRFDFTVPASATSVCVDVTHPTGTSTVYIGPRALPVSELPVDLVTMAVCGGPPPQGNGSIGDFVWRDDNGDGIQDTGEPGLGGVAVTLHDCSGNPLDSTTSASDGSYLFSNLAAGSYMLHFQAPAGFVISPALQGSNLNINSDPDPANGLTECITLATDQIRLGYDAGMIPQGNPPGTASIGDFVWQDDDGDGRQDNGEPGLAGVTVNLQDCSDNTVATTTTAADGSYLFDNLAAGDYLVEFVLLTDHSFSPRFVGSGGGDSDPFPTTGKTACKAQNEGQARLGIDAGMIPDGGGPPPGGTASIGDFVWQDDDADGRQDNGEPGLAGVTVNLQDCGGTTLFTTTTAADGSYLFSNLAAGQYVVEYVLLADHSFSPRFVGSAGGDSDPFPATGKTACKVQNEGQSRLGIDAGMIPGGPPPTGGATFGDFVWRDDDGDGIQDGNEPGLSGVTVGLQDCSGTPLSTTTSASDGSYIFDNLAAGSYKIHFTAPPGFTISPRLQGPGGQDSDPHPGSGLTGCKSMTASQSRLGIDAGMVPN